MSNETNSQDLFYEVPGIAKHLLKAILFQTSPMGYHPSKLAGHEVMKGMGELSCKL